MSMVLPSVVGFKLSGKLRDGVTATNLVLTVTHDGLSGSPRHRSSGYNLIYGMKIS